MTTEKTNSYHIFRKILEIPRVASELLHAHLPKDLLEIIDTNTLQLEKGSFIEDDLKDSCVDALFSVKVNDNSDGFIYLLLQHKSSPDDLMAFHLFKYRLNICDKYLQKNPNSKTLPLVYPLIIYSGKETYNAPRNLWDLFSNPDLAKEIWT